MKRSTHSALVVFAILTTMAPVSLPAFARALDIVEVPVESVLAPPVGYDDNDNIEIVLYGHLPSACYTLGDYLIERQPDGLTMKIRQFALRRTDGPCAAADALPGYMNALVPFTETVALGQLAPGQYRFEYRNEAGSPQVRLLDVSKAGLPAVDSLPYAATSEVSASDLVNGVGTVKIRIGGILNTTCTDLDSNIQIKRTGDVYVVLPLIRVQHGVFCGQVIRPFSVALDLGQAPPPGRYLIHVRSMNGRSLNKVFEVGR